jgi:hypothetical protein
MKKVIISRSFVEFGPFAIEEIHSFHQRGLLSGEDHLLIVGTDEWFRAHQLADKAPHATAAPTEKPAAKKTAKKAAKKAAKKSAPDSPTP